LDLIQSYHYLVSYLKLGPSSLITRFGSQIEEVCFWFPDFLSFIIMKDDVLSGTLNVAENALFPKPVP